MKYERLGKTNIGLSLTFDVVLEATKGLCFATSSIICGETTQGDKLEETCILKSLQPALPHDVRSINH